MPVTHQGPRDTEFLITIRIKKKKPHKKHKIDLKKNRKIGKKHLKIKQNSRYNKDGIMDFAQRKMIKKKKSLRFYEKIKIKEMRVNP